MKKVILGICLILGLLTANAQIVEKGETNPVWGVRASFDVNLPGHVSSNIMNEKMFTTGTGGSVGAVCNILVADHLYIEPAVSLFYDTYAYDGLVVIGDETGYEESDPKVYKIGIRIPVVIGYSFGVSDRLSIAPYTGPEISYSFAGDIKFHNEDRLNPNGFSLFGKNGDQRRFDCGWKIGVAFFSEKWSFNIDGTIGMTNLMTRGMKFHENRGTVSITRYF